MNSLASHHAGWEALVDQLQGEGWTAVVTCWAAPVQLEGRLPSGEPFYFRARWDDVLLAIGGSDPADVPEWEAHETYGSAETAAASYLPSDEGLLLLRALHQRYVDR